MTELYIIRHAEAEGNLYQRFHGHTDGKITENGKKQLQRLSAYMGEIPLDGIYTSDLSRTRETAEAVRAGRNIPVTLKKELREIFGGAWENLPFSELERIYPAEFAAWENEPAQCTLPEGESIRNLQRRAVAVVTEILEKNTGRKIAVVTHGTVIRTLCCYFRGLPLEALNEVGWVDNASVTKVRVDGRAEICFEGERSFLAGLSTLDRQDWWQSVGSLISEKDID